MTQPQFAIARDEACRDTSHTPVPVVGFDLTLCSGRQVTYTFEVVDDPEQQQEGGNSSDLLAKSRQIMVPQVRPPGTASPMKPLGTSATATATASRLTVGKVGVDCETGRIVESVF